MPSDKQPSKTAEHRRSNKPIMEKKRRARINNCLNELKNLLLEAMRKDPARHSKLEKADILEMTVKHLQNLQRQQMALQVTADPGVITKYRAGFNECAEEVSRYMGSLDGIGSPIKQRLLDHLANCMSGFGSSVTASGAPSFFRNNSGVCDSSVSATGPMQLIPSRLPNGEIALLLPSQTMANWPLNKHRFVSIYNNKNNIAPSAAPSEASKCESISRSTLLTVNVGYNTRSSPSPHFVADTPVTNARYRHSRCDSRCSLSPAMSDYSDTCSKYHDNLCSSDLSNAGSHFEPEMTWSKHTFGKLSPERSSLGYQSAEPAAFGMGMCSSSSPTSSNERLSPCGSAAVECPIKRHHEEPEILLPVNLSKDADKMWRPW